MADTRSKLAPRCDLVVRGIGQVVDVEQTERRFAKLFSLEPEKAQRILTGRRVVVRSQLDPVLARKYVACLEKMGVRAEAVLITEEYLLAKAAAKIKAAVRKQAGAVSKRPAHEKPAPEKNLAENAGSVTIALLPVKPRAIYYIDYGEESIESSAMHQYVEPFVPIERQKKYIGSLLFLCLLTACVVLAYVKRDVLMHTSIHLGASHFKH